MFVKFETFNIRCDWCRGLAFPENTGYDTLERAMDEARAAGFTVFYKQNKHSAMDCCHRSQCRESLIQRGYKECR